MRNEIFPTYAHHDGGHLVGVLPGFDLYYSRDHDEVIARFGDRPGEYLASPMSLAKRSRLTTPLRTAVLATLWRGLNE